MTSFGCVLFPGDVTAHRFDQVVAVIQSTAKSERKWSDRSELTIIRRRSARHWRHTCWMTSFLLVKLVHVSLLAVWVVVLERFYHALRLWTFRTVWFSLGSFENVSLWRQRGIFDVKCWLSSMPSAYHSLSQTVGTDSISLAAWILLWQLRSAHGSRWRMGGWRHHAMQGKAAL